MAQQVLLYLLLLSAAFGILHVVLVVRRRSLPLVDFVALGALASVAAGLATLSRALVLQGRGSPATGVAWTLAMAVGFLAVGTVLAVGWIGIVKGGAAALRRLAGRRSSPSARR